MSTLHRQELTAEPGVTSRDGPDQTAQKKNPLAPSTDVCLFLCGGGKKQKLELQEGWFTSALPGGAAIECPLVVSPWRLWLASGR